MYSMALQYSPDSGIQAVLWTVLGIFFVLTLLSWWVAGRDWRKDEERHSETPQEQPGDGGNA